MEILQKHSLLNILDVSGCLDDAFHVADIPERHSLINDEF